MDTKALMHADYLDILFDNRNKTYGGYELRKNYNQRVGKAVGGHFNVSIDTLLPDNNLS